MIEPAIRLFAGSRNYHAKAYDFIKAVRDAAESTADPKELADLAYALREVLRHIEDVAKDCNAIQKIVAAKFGLACVATGQTEISTQYCTAKPVPKSHVTLHKRRDNPELFDALMREMGVTDEEAIRNERIRPHWPAVCEWITQRNADGQPLPAGIGPEAVKGYYEITVRAKTDILPPDPVK